MAEPELINNRYEPGRTSVTLDRESLKQLATLMDSLFEIPGVRWRIGLDSILGLVPGVGDVATTIVALTILQAATQHRVPRVTLARMGLNLLVDWLVGSIPVVGDAFDVYWKANQRNVRLLEQHLDANPHVQSRARRRDWLFLGVVLAVLLVGILGSLWLSFQFFRFLGSLLWAG